MSHSYTNLSKKADELTGTDYFKDRVDPWKNWVYTFTARPKKTVSTSFSWTDQTEWKGDDKTDSNKTEAKVSIQKDDIKTHYTFAGDKFAIKAEKEALLTGDFHLDADLSGEWKPAKDEWKVTANASGHSNTSGDVKAFLTVNAEFNQKKEILAKASVNVAHDNSQHFGLYFEHDTKDFKRLWGQLAYTPEGDHTGFLRADIQKHFVSLGYINKHSNDITHAFEASYNAGEGAKGFQGFPVEFKFGAEYKLSDSTHLKSALRAGEHYAAEWKVDHKIDEHWSVGSHQDFNSARLKAKSGPYNLGFKVNYKL